MPNAIRIGTRFILYVAYGPVFGVEGWVPHEPIVTPRWTYLSSIDAARRPAAVAVECGNSQNKYAHKGMYDIFIYIYT
jgi:hypothetical protein